MWVLATLVHPAVGHVQTAGTLSVCLLPFVEVSILTYRWPLLAVLCTLTLILILKSTQHPSSDASPLQAEQPPLVETLTVEFTREMAESTLYGRVGSASVVALTAPVSTYVEQLNVLEGVSVQKGETLVVLDDRDHRLAIDQHSANIAELRAKMVSEELRKQTDKKALKQTGILLELAQKEHSRQLSLLKNRLISESKVEESAVRLATQQLALLEQRKRVDDSANRLAQLQAQLRREQAMEEQALLALDRVEIKAPYDGRISKVHAAVGGRVQEGSILIEMYDHQLLEVRAQISNRYLPRLRKLLTDEQAVHASLNVEEGERQSYMTTLNRLAAAVENDRGGIDGFFRLPPDAGGELELGRLLTIELMVPLAFPVLRLPPNSLYQNNHVYRIDENGRLAAVEVSPVGFLHDSDREWVLVKAPRLQSGDRLLVTRLANVTTGLAVRLSLAASGHHQDRPTP